MWANDPEMAKKWEKEEEMKEAKKRDYKAEYKKYGSSKKAKKYRAELNAYNRKKGTYGNGDGKDASHKGGKIVGFEAESKNRGRAEKSRLKKESWDSDVKDFGKKSGIKVKPHSGTLGAYGAKPVKPEISKKVVPFFKKKGYKLIKKHKVSSGAYKGDLVFVLQGKDKKKYLVSVNTNKEGTNINFNLHEAAKRDYKAEYKKFQSSTKSKKYRAELNAYNRKKGTYGNGDGKDASHKGGKIVGFEAESKNRGRAEKSRLKKESKYDELFNESGIMYHAGVKKYGKEGMRKIQSAAGKKKSHAEIGKIKDKYDKTKKEGKLKEDYKNSEWEVYLKDEKGREKIVKKAKSKRAATILYNKIIKSDDYYEVGMRAIKEGKLTEGGAQIAKTILQQLGGNKFIAMTGAKNLGHTNKGLQMKIGRNSKGITHVKVTLTSMDTYEVEFIKVRGTNIKVVKKVKGVYADQLGEIFKKYTGMNVRL